MADDATTAAAPTTASAASGSGRGDPWAAVAAFLGAVGAGIAFAENAGLSVASLVFTETYWLSTELRWPRLIPIIAVSAIVLAAAVSRRWGWVVACVGLAAYVGAYQWELAGSIGPHRYIMVLAVTGTVAVGGALAAFGVADRVSRLAIVAGLAVGINVGLPALTAALTGVMGGSRLQRLLVPLGLCLIAAVVWFVRGTGAARSWLDRTVPAPDSSAAAPDSAAAASERSASDIASADAPPARRSWVTPVLAVAVALGATLLHFGLLAFLNHLDRAGASRRRPETIELLHQVGLFGIVLVAGLVLTIYTYRRGGSLAARWVLVGLAAGTASLFTMGGLFTVGGFAPVVSTQRAGEVWLTIGIAAAVVVLGVGLSRFAAVPWDGLGLLVLAVGVVLRPPQGLDEFREQNSILRLVIVFAVGFVLAASLASLSTQTSPRGVGGPGEVAALVSLGFGVSLLATSIIFPASVVGRPWGILGPGPAIALGIMAIGVLALYGLGRMARSGRRAIEAEARREAS